MGDALAVVAAFCFALAATLQQKGALGMGARLEGAKGYLHLATQKWWILGTLALLAGYGFQAVALVEGQLSIVQALLVTTIVFALPLGHWLTAQSVNRTEVVGALFVVLGLMAFMYFGEESSGNSTAAASTWAVTFAVFGLLALVLILLGRHGDASRRAALLGSGAGVLYALSAAMWAPTADAYSSGGVGNLLSSWEFYAWAGAAAVAFVVQQVSLATGQLASSVATVSVCNPMVSVIIGIVVLQERLSDPAWHKVLAFAGLGVALYAAIVITRSTEGQGEAEPHAEAGMGGVAAS